MPTIIPRSTLGRALLLVGTPIAAFVLTSVVLSHWALTRLDHRHGVDASRFSRVQDYAATQRLEGVTRAAVLADLGPPLWDFEVWTYAVSNKGLGLGAGWPPCHKFEPTVHVRFDTETGRVTSATGSYLSQAANPVPFDSEAWRSLAHFQHQRGPLAEDLVRSGQLEGLARSDVQHLLGAPDITEQAMYYQFGWNNSGYERCLELWFDDQWRVVRTVIESETG